MSAKIALVLVAAFVSFQLFSVQTDATIIRRDAPAPEKNDLEEALNTFKQGVEDIVKKLEDSELVQNATRLANEFGQKVKVQGDKLIEKIKATTPATAPQ